MRKMQTRCYRWLQVLTILACLMPLFSCQSGKRMAEAEVDEGDTLAMHYAEHLTIVKHGDYTEVILDNPWQKGKELHRYLLVPKDMPETEASRAFDSAQSKARPTSIVRTPVERSVVFTSPHCQLLYDIGCADVIKGVCDLAYINIKDIHDRTSTSLPDSTRHITDCGSSMQPSIEKIIDLNTEALLISPFENSGGFGKLDNLNIPIIETADYMETSAMGRAEWMRFYGILFGKEKEADSLFHLVDSTYHSLQQMAIKLPKGRSIITERKTGNVWYTPGGQSTMGMILSDANAHYPFASDKHSGSIALSSEQMLDKAEHVELWAFKNFGKALSKQALLAEYPGYAMLRAFKTGEIYQCDTSVVPYFEETAFHPDRLLREFIQLAHPNVQLGGLRYYKKFE